LRLSLSLAFQQKPDRRQRPKKYFPAHASRACQSPLLMDPSGAKKPGRFYDHFLRPQQTIICNKVT
jgi:hypothetical protein